MFYIWSKLHVRPRQKRPPPPCILSRAIWVISISAFNEAADGCSSFLQDFSLFLPYFLWQDLLLRSVAAAASSPAAVMQTCVEELQDNGGWSSAAAVLLEGPHWWLLIHINHILKTWNTFPPALPVSRHWFPLCGNKINLQWFLHLLQTSNRSVSVISVHKGGKSSL